jgi:twitching motility protein PilT
MEKLQTEGHLEAVRQTLGSCPLFHGLRPEHLEEVGRHGELYAYAKGEALAREGDASDAFFIFVRGEASVTLTSGGEPIELARLGPPEAVGEMGVLLESARSASVVAAEPVLALRFSAPQFHNMLKNMPFFGLVLARTLAARLHAASRRIPLPELGDPAMRPEPAALRLLPPELQMRHRIVPLKAQGNTVTVGCVDEPGEGLLGTLRKLLPGMELRPVKISAGLFDEALKGSAAVSLPTAERLPAQPTPTSPQLDRLLKRMVAEGASDLHLSTAQVPRWRVDGEMRPLADLGVFGPNAVMNLLAPAMEDRHREEFSTTNDADFAYEIPGLARFRVNMFRDVRGVGAVLRVIPSTILTIEQLGLPEAVTGFCDLPKGLVLVTGPTGSGKSTTLAAMIDHINRSRADHIITLEDPIEFVHQSQKAMVNQREVGAHTDSFSRALRAALREDPDIVLVGEMRDLETIQLALETAQTGHLVFGTLHTATAIGTVERIVGMFTPEQQPQVRATLGEVLKGVVSQTLLKKRGGGRVAAFEILVCTYAVQNLVREMKTNQIANVMATGRGHGNRLLNDELTRLVQRGLVDYEEAYSKAVDKTDFEKRMGRG